MTAAWDAVDPIPVETRLSLKLALVLRHRPHEIGVALDRNGWVDVDALIAGLNNPGSGLWESKWPWPSVDRSLLDRVLASDDGRRYEMSPCGRRIRAVRGHTVDIELECSPASPPDLLYHGTTRQALPAIRREGLTPQARQAVHLATDPHTALYACRQGPPAILVISANAMHEAGYAFEGATNGTWLTARVPPQFLRFP